MLDHTGDNFTRLASALSISEQELLSLKLDEFAKSGQLNGTGPESTEESTMRRLISIAHDLGGVTSVANNDAEIASIQAELGNICKREAYFKEIHRQKTLELEDAWDKLIRLRKHISFFRSAIEETTIEEAQNQVQNWKPGKTKGRLSSNTPITGRGAEKTGEEEKWMDEESAALFGSISTADFERDEMAAKASAEMDQQIQWHILRERVKSREALRAQVDASEKKLETLREDIGKTSSLLIETSKVIYFSLCLHLWPLPDTLSTSLHLQTPSMPTP
jgi:hypothetical protein